jgi:hypothetical protein
MELGGMGAAGGGSSGREHALAGGGRCCGGRYPPPDGEDIALAVVVDAHGDVGDAHHFAAGDVDDLLVQQVAADAQHVLVVVVGEQLLVAELDAACRG